MREQNKPLSHLIPPFLHSLFLFLSRPGSLSVTTLEIKGTPTEATDPVRAFELLLCSLTAMLWVMKEVERNVWSSQKLCYYSIRNNSGCLAIFFPSEWPCTCVRFVKLNRTIRSETDTDISSLIQPVWMRKLSQQQATQSQDVKKNQKPFQVFPGNKNTLSGKHGWPKMFPCGWLLCYSLDSHSGQTRAVWGQQQSITIDWPIEDKKQSEDFVVK